MLRWCFADLLKNYGKQRWEMVLLYDLLTNFPSL